MAFNALTFKILLTSQSSLLPTSSFALNYFTASAAADLFDVSDLGNKILLSLTTIPAGGTNAPSKYLGTSVSRTANNCHIEGYDITSHLAGTPHGSPIVLGNWTASTALTVGDLPEGCCVVITLQAPYGTDVEFAPGARPRARDRGRIYFGPMHGGSFTADANGRAALSTIVRTDLTAWIKAINTFTTAPHTCLYNLGVWSRKNAAIKPLQECWVDDRFDYQRKRAGEAATKTIVTLP